ncbi:MAG TPA: SRPBCC domain-containing protein [Caulobacteraceae bacterium]|jgi:uncharacterized protein YndB with AHSA1/START domain|nr:SRPBCC domain-containing protein [Caulobacteraceae bacterium]
MKPDRPEIDLAFELAYPPDKVWKALTTPELLARWLGPNDMVLELGARFTVRPETGPPATCEVVEIDKARRRLRLTWTVDAEKEATTVRFELVPTPAGGTVLRIAHCGFGAAAAQAPAQPPRLRLSRRAPAVRANPSRMTMRWAA